MSNDSWQVAFHLRSPRSWLNDPNGLCVYGGTYRFFYQYNDAWPYSDQKAWGQFSSPDLVHWNYEGVSIEPSLDEDRHGVYSGSCIVRKDSDGSKERLWAYYTGNVINPGPDHNRLDRSFARDGREANQIVCTSVDGVHFGPKTVLLRNGDYPDYCTLHVRDPKVWEQDGQLLMLLGARDISDRGLCLLYQSEDGMDWFLRQAINSQYPFGYMWECPNLVQMEEQDYLAFSPQGLPRMHDKWHNLCQAGYIALPQPVLHTTEVDERDFVEWDHGHDFYAPQMFQDDSGRWILVGWLGGFDRHYQSAPNGLEWCHCLTVPRLLTRNSATGKLLQTPVPELDTLRRDLVRLPCGKQAKLGSRSADILLEGMEDGDGSLVLDQSLEIYRREGRLGIRFLNKGAAAGREDRSIPCSQLEDLRVLVDGSVVEVYANGGAEVFSLRWFCENDPALRVSNAFSCDAIAWTMEDVLADMYRSANAPSLSMPGRNL